MGGSSKAPPAPDYVLAAREQGRQNIDAARVTAALNRVNQSGPMGSVSYSQDPNDPDRFTQNTTLSPEQQQLYETSTRGQQGRTDLGNQQLSMYGSQIGTGINTSGLPQRVSNIQGGQQQTSVNAPSGMYGRINTMGLPGLPGQNDFGGERQRVEDALYGRNASRLDDQFARREEDQRAQLLNRGLREGTEAYANAERDLTQSRTDAYGDLRDRAVLAGGQEQSRLFSDALQARGQGFGERSTQAQFGNQAANDRFSNELARAQLYNQAQSAQFGQGVTNAQLANTVRDQGIGEQQINQDQLLQGLSFLYGNGYQPPQFANGADGAAGGVQAPDIFGAINNQYGAQTDIYNSNQARRSGNTQAVVGTLGTVAAIY
jgi:hypothetical protein